MAPGEPTCEELTCAPAGDGAADVRIEIEPEEQFSVSIVRAASCATGLDTEELPPLYEAVDPDALDALFRRTSDGTVRTDGVLRFSYAGLEVCVDGGAVVVVRVA